MPNSNPRYIQRCVIAAGTVVLTLPLIIVGWLNFHRPQRSNIQQQLFRGIAYQRIVRNRPRPMMIHLVTVDLNQTEIKPVLTPPEAQNNEYTKARTTSQFLREFQVQLAINASYFRPFHENTPWDYYPQIGDRVTPIGQTIVNQQPYTQAEAGWHVICFTKDNRAQIPGTEKCPTNTVQAVAGSQILVKNSRFQPNTNARSDKPYPRVAIGVDRTGKKLSIVLVDGKQPLYSEGMTRDELAKLLLELKTDAALNLDGGGSTTLVINTPSGIKILNAPIHTKIPQRERPIANHLGFTAKKL